MKKILQFLTITFFIFLSIFSASAYELTDKDYDIVERIDEKIFTIIESKRNVTAKKVVHLLENIIEKKQLSERVEEILLTILDDVEYEYYLGEYEEVELDEDIISEGNFSENKNSEEEYDSVYKIDGSTLTLEKGEKGVNDSEIFNIFVKLIPENSREKIIRFKVYNKPEGDTFAYVNQDKKDQSKWNLVVNSAMFYKDGKLDLQESIHTFVHELFHTTSLSSTQMNHNDYETCENYELNEGCLYTKSYLNTFITKYWKNNFEASQDDQEDDFYLEDESAYVTDYAATNPGEDIAESFTYFVLQSKPANSENISDQKILFFYKYKQLVKLRNEIRKGINELRK